MTKRNSESISRVLYHHHVMVSIINLEHILLYTSIASYPLTCTSNAQTSVYLELQHTV